jgi:hypothetical protein
MPSPYREDKGLGGLIAPDRRPLVAATVGAVIGALVGVSGTLVWVSSRTMPPRESAYGLPPPTRTALPPPLPQAQAATPVLKPCTLDPSSAIQIARDPMPDVPRYPNGILTQSNGDVQNGTAYVVLETCDPMTSVVAFYHAMRGMTLHGETAGTSRHTLRFQSGPGPSGIAVRDVEIEVRDSRTRITLHGAGTNRTLGTPIEKPSAPPPSLETRF